MGKTGSAAHIQHGGKSQAACVDTVCARRKAAFQQIIWWPDLDLSWLMPGVKVLQVLLALDAALRICSHTVTVHCHQSYSHHLSTLHRLDVIKHSILLQE